MPIVALEHQIHRCALYQATARSPFETFVATVAPILLQARDFEGTFSEAASRQSDAASFDAAGRTGMVISAKGLAEHHEFPGLKAFGRIEATREKEGKVTSETRIFALSWMPTPEVLLETVRAHWAIENALHWQLDVSFREDAARNRKDNGPGNIAILRRRELDVVRREQLRGLALDQAQARGLG